MKPVAASAVQAGINRRVASPPARAIAWWWRNGTVISARKASAMASMRAGNFRAAAISAAVTKRTGRCSAGKRQGREFGIWAFLGLTHGFDLRFYAREFVLRRAGRTPKTPLFCERYQSADDNADDQSGKDDDEKRYRECERRHFACEWIERHDDGRPVRDRE